MKRPKPFEPEKYKNILKEVGEYRYKHFESGDPFLEVILDNPPLELESVIAATSAAPTPGYEYEHVPVAAGKQFVLLRLLRRCAHNGTEHYNADDQIIFPDESGNYWRDTRKDSSDHYNRIIDESGEIRNVAEAYGLPREKEGAVENYIPDNASLRFRIDCPERKETER